MMHIERGALQSIQKESAIFCGMVTTFCKKLNWVLLAAGLECMGNRLTYGAADDLLPLVRLGPEVMCMHTTSLYCQVWS